MLGAGSQGWKCNMAYTSWRFREIKLPVNDGKVVESAEGVRRE